MKNVHAAFFPIQSLKQSTCLMHYIQVLKLNDSFEWMQLKLLYRFSLKIYYMALQNLEYIAWVA